MEQSGARGEEARLKLLGRRLAWVMLLRVALISALLGATFVLNYGTVTFLKAPSPRFLLSLIAFIYLATIVYSVWYRTGKRMLLLSWIQFGVDSLLWGGLAYATGGITSGFTFLFDLWVIVAAVVLGGRAAFISATASTVVLLLMVLLMGPGRLQPLSDQLMAVTTLRETLYFLGINVVSLFVVAGLVSSLVARLERTGRGLDRERIERADLATLHSDIIRSLNVGLATTGQSGEILTMNPEGMGIIELGGGQVEGRNIMDLFPDLSGVIGSVDVLNARGHGVGLTPSGRKVPLDYTVAPLVAADGKRRGNVVIFNDLTKVKSLEADLERARKLAALGELAASLAHEIRNPLSAVSGSFQMIAGRSDLNAEERALCEIVLRELGRMEHLVNDMLEYTRPRNPDRHPIHVGKMVEEVVDTFMVSKEAEGLQVNVTMEDKALEAALDQGQIKQVLWNLLRNAAGFSQEEDVVGILVAPVGDDIVIEVSDAGPGVPPGDEKMIFDPFFSTRERGLGLGLAICRGIAKAHDGKIEVLPGETGGAVFRLTIPRNMPLGD
jgi:two-component system sensor histidine kinase PilS (NtrC family)